MEPLVALLPSPKLKLLPLLDPDPEEPTYRGWRVHRH